MAGLCPRKFPEDTLPPLVKWPAGAVPRQMPHSCQGSLFQLVDCWCQGPMLLLCALSWNMNESIEKLRLLSCTMGKAGRGDLPWLHIPAV